MHKVKNKGRKKPYGGMCGWTKELQLNEEKKTYRSHTGSDIMLGAISSTLLLCLTEEMRSCKLSLRILNMKLEEIIPTHWINTAGSAPVRLLETDF